jgi:hypothetical protein
MVMRKLFPTFVGMIRGNHAKAREKIDPGGDAGAG